MASKSKSNTSTPSTHTWRWSGTIPGPPPRVGQSAAGRPPWPFLPWRRAYRPLWVEIWHQGGAEAEVRIRCRGYTFRFPGDLSILDVVMAINGQRGQAWESRALREFNRAADALEARDRKRHSE